MEEAHLVACTHTCTLCKKPCKQDSHAREDFHGQTQKGLHTRKDTIGLRWVYAQGASATLSPPSPLHTKLSHTHTHTQADAHMLTHMHMHACNRAHLGCLPNVGRAAEVLAARCKRHARRGLLRGRRDRGKVVRQRVAKGRGRFVGQRQPGTPARADARGAGT